MSQDTRNLPVDAYGAAEGSGIRRTEMHCHQCSKTFVAELDFDINGDHIIECSHCGHEHCRTIKDGKITDARWDSRPNVKSTDKKTTWKSSVIQAKTTSVSQFLRDKWLNREDAY